MAGVASHGCGPVAVPFLSFTRRIPAERATGSCMQHIGQAWSLHNLNALYCCPLGSVMQLERPVLAERQLHRGWQCRQQMKATALSHKSGTKALIRTHDRMPVDVGTGQRGGLAGRACRHESTDFAGGMIGSVQLKNGWQPLSATKTKGHEMMQPREGDATNGKRIATNGSKVLPPIRGETGLSWAG